MNRLKEIFGPARWLLYVGLAAGLVFADFPIVWMFFTSFKSNTEIFALPPTLLPKVFTFEAYHSIFSDPVRSASSSTATSSPASLRS